MAFSLPSQAETYETEIVFPADEEGLRGPVETPLTLGEASLPFAKVLADRTDFIEGRKNAAPATETAFLPCQRKVLASMDTSAVIAAIRSSIPYLPMAPVEVIGGSPAFLKTALPAKITVSIFTLMGPALFGTFQKSKPEGAESGAATGTAATGGGTRMPFIEGFSDVRGPIALTTTPSATLA